MCSHIHWAATLTFKKKKKKRKKQWLSLVTASWSRSLFLKRTQICKRCVTSKPFIGTLVSECEGPTRTQRMLCPRNSRVVLQIQSQRCLMKSLNISSESNFPFFFLFFFFPEAAECICLSLESLKSTTEALMPVDNTLVLNGQHSDS